MSDPAFYVARAKGHIGIAREWRNLAKVYPAKADAYEAEAVKQFDQAHFLMRWARDARKHQERQQVRHAAE